MDIQKHQRPEFKALKERLFKALSFATGLNNGLLQDSLL